MANLIDRSNPGDLSGAGANTFRTSLNNDRDIVYDHATDLETEIETVCAEYFGTGTMPGNAALLYIDDPTPGRVYCPVDYLAVIGGVPVKTSAIIYQSYTASALNHVYLVVGTDGTLTLRVATGAVSEGENELWIADVTAVPAIDNEPTGKAYAGQALGMGASPEFAGLTLTSFSGAVSAAAGVLSAGTLSAANGGTGHGSYAIGDLLYASGATALSKLADVAIGSYLASGGIGVVPSWAVLNQAAVVGLTIGESPVFTGLTLSGLTQGSIPFIGASGVISQDNAALFWDAATDRLGVGTASPDSTGLFGGGAETPRATFIGGICFKNQAGTAKAFLAIYSGNECYLISSAGGYSYANLTVVTLEATTFRSTSGMVLNYDYLVNEVGAHFWALRKSAGSADFKHEQIRVLANGYMQVGGSIPDTSLATLTPATQFEVAEKLVITGAVTDGYSAAITLDPEYTKVAAGNVAVTRHNYIDVNTPALTNVTITDACVFRFDANAGTHPAVAAASTKTTPTAVDAWLKANLNGTLLYVPGYLSMTA